MTEIEAKDILEIMATADSGCHSCVRDLFRQFIKKYGYGDLAQKILDRDYGELYLEPEDET
jgi:hypothetical protein